MNCCSFAFLRGSKFLGFQNNDDDTVREHVAVPRASLSTRRRCAEVTGLGVFYRFFCIQLSYTLLYLCIPQGTVWLFLFIAFGVAAFILFREYLSPLLSWLARQDGPEGPLLVGFFFILTSFPMIFGYTVMNLGM